jgi:hypothetical protein
MDRRKALKNVAFYWTASLLYNWSFIWKFTLRENEKIKCFSGTDEEILNLLILLFQLQNSPGAKAAGVEFYFNYD